MKGRFPRTTREFLEHDRKVVLRCDCGTTTWLRPENLIQRLGAEFDLYDGFMELEDTFPCETCGQLQSIAFYKPREMNRGLLPFEKATTDSLELSAFANARDRSKRIRMGWDPDPPPSTGRYRKFGPRK